MSTIPIIEIPNELLLDVLAHVGFSELLALSNTTRGMRQFLVDLRDAQKKEEELSSRFDHLLYLVFFYKEYIHTPGCILSRRHIGHVHGFDRAEFSQHVLRQARSLRIVENLAIGKLPSLVEPDLPLDLPLNLELFLASWPHRAAIGAIWPGVKLGTRGRGIGRNMLNAGSLRRTSNTLSIERNAPLTIIQGCVSLGLTSRQSAGRASFALDGPYAGQVLFVDTDEVITIIPLYLYLKFEMDRIAELVLQPTHKQR